ncbi:hypothetical protein [Enterobacter kobei]|uniref:hypothetical protein n=1 Tax=Enterobacter kobei TaxID=208224 RepID=UPI003BD83998
MSTRKGLLAVALLSAPFIVNAATLTNAKNAEADVTFFAPNQFTHTLTATKNLTAGTFSQLTQIAAGSINTTGTVKANYAIQFPATAHIATAGIQNVIVTGKNDPANTIPLNIIKDPSMTAGGFRVEQINGSGWAVYDTAVDVLKYQVVVNGTVKADVYPVTVSAAVYTN